MQRCSTVLVTLGQSLSVPSATVTGQLQHFATVNYLCLSPWYHLFLKSVVEAAQIVAHMKMAGV